MASKTAWSTLFLAIGLLAGCEQTNVYAPPPPPKVTVATPLQQSVTEYLEFTGTTRAVAAVEVRARVAGFLKSMHFTPGTQVEMGDLLFTIDPREYEAELNAAEAEREAAQAQLKRAETEYARAQRLFKQKAGSEADVVRWLGERDVAKADVLRAQAKIDRARLNVSFTQVTAPISGRVGRNLVDPGNLVGEGEPTLLTTVTDSAPMHVYFSLNERDLLRAYEMYRARVKEKGYNPNQEPDSRADISLFLGVANEEGYPHEGEMDFADSELDTGTGTLQLRGIFPNSENPPVLLPGLFARVRMPIQELPDALLVTERAIGSDQTGRYLLVVNSEKLVERRLIRQGQQQDGMRVIEEGLLPGERVIVAGIQRARPGATVEIEQVDMASLSTSALRAAAMARKAAAAASESSSAELENPP